MHRQRRSQPEYNKFPCFIAVHKLFIISASRLRNGSDNTHESIFIANDIKLGKYFSTGERVRESTNVSVD